MTKTKFCGFCEIFVVLNWHKVASERKRQEFKINSKFLSSRHLSDGMR